MARILYLVHRTPYPPNKGDKVRSYHLLQHLVARHEVLLGTFVDDPADQEHLPFLKTLCAEVQALPLNPRRARVASLAGLLTGRALTLHYYNHAAMRAWVRGLVSRQAVDCCVAFSSSMAQYVEPEDAVPLVLDMVDVDSAKWAEYAKQHRRPLSWLYAREGRKLLEVERSAAALSKVTYLATQKEVDLFKGLAPECEPKVRPLGNGVDTAFFDPAVSRVSPFDAEEQAIVFTGAMDYWPNVDAVCWFVGEVLPGLRQANPRIRFHIVGRAPTPAVRALSANADGGVVVTGTVLDVRPYLQHAAVVVAPLRLARGIQNKILEAMAMGRPVVAADACVSAMNVKVGQDLLAAREAVDYQDAIQALLARAAWSHALGQAGRNCVVRHYGWEANLSAIDQAIASAAPQLSHRPFDAHAGVSA